jgi:hypothetical protein
MSTPVKLKSWLFLITGCSVLIEFFLLARSQILNPSYLLKQSDIAPSSFNTSASTASNQQTIAAIPPPDELGPSSNPSFQIEKVFAIWHDMKQAVNTTGRTPPPERIANFITRQVQIDGFKDVVLATHTSASKSKLTNLGTQINLWGGPVSAALYISCEEDIHSLEEFITSANFLPNITTIHVMVEIPHKEGYPNKDLRNLAMEHIGSDYFVALDVDFIPSKDSYPGIISLLRSNEEFRKELHDHRVFALPAFEILPRKGQTFASQDILPAYKSHLKNMIREGLAKKFHFGHFAAGHGPTNYRRWFEEKGTVPKAN